MKRKSLLLDENILREATRLAKVKTHSEAVDLALRDLIRRVKEKRTLELAGSGLWQGDLAAMRGDSPALRTRRTPRRGRIP